MDGYESVPDDSRFQISGYDKLEYDRSRYQTSKYDDSELITTEIIDSRDLEINQPWYRSITFYRILCLFIVSTCILFAAILYVGIDLIIRH